MQGERVRSSHGTGLGLWIARAVVAADGGTVTAPAEGGPHVEVRLPRTTA
ncbi:signal transduction histidine kinase [Nonomuraea thailandensis]|uniref:Signal transduction histidine kinase n=1 Tax=Nonomuraea thailandensis TaxID=1188745 RepID=A0A9X2K3V6_9ACTN|nr:hypothetical protein [Nonomuraea thailandensis]MCP2355961.1 signal transduction histidine kinase [Nonomuraea thailandensis]